MAIYLDDQERIFLERLLKSMKSTFWVKDHLLQKVIADRERIEKMESCEHIPAKFTGEKTCCEKCESYYEPGMGFVWKQAG